MTRTIIIYAALLAVAVFLLEWAQYQYLARQFGLEIFILLIALGFGVLGVWAGMRLTRQAAPASPFQRNHAAQTSLGITEREYEVLMAMAGGASNKEIARDLGVSPNTVKTHLARLFEKLDVSKRIQAIEKARLLSLIP